MPEPGQIIAYSNSKNLLLSKGALKLLEDRTEWTGIIDRLSDRKLSFVTESNIQEEIMESKAKTEAEDSSTPEISRSSKFKPLAAEIQSDLKFRDDLNPGKSDSRGEMEDFVSYFKDGYTKRRDIMQKTRNVQSTELSKVKNVSPREELSVIGMVFEKYETKNGHLIITLEDLNSRCKVLVLKDRTDLMRLFQDVIEDDVVLVTGQKGSDFNQGAGKKDSEPMIVAQDVVFPEIPIHKPHYSREDVSVVATSDLHVGHKKFLEGAFRKFLAWLKGDVGSSKQAELAGKVKYLLINGDCVEGVGVYPEQEDELVITDIYRQYEEFEKLVQEIPDYVEVIIAPGQHDAVRVEDPVPQLNFEKYMPNLGKLKNIHFATSPNWMELHGVKFLSYYGLSMHNMWSLMPHKLSAENPEKAMIEYLRKRHLAPYYGETPNSRGHIFPEKRDYMAITEVPDVLVTSHVHRNAYAEYRGTLALNTGCWQSQTVFQAKQGHLPTPGIVPIISLREMKVNEMRFIGPGSA